MISLTVNGPYPFPIPATGGAISDFLREGGNRLLIVMPEISDFEAKIMRTGKLRCGLLAKNGAIMFIWELCDKKGKPVLTLDSPFDARVITDIQHYDITNADQRLLVEVHIVDTATGLIRGLRGITMPAKLTLEFLSSVQDQLSISGGDGQLKEWMQLQPMQLSKKIKMWEMGL